jgi:hypothetical protein
MPHFLKTRTPGNSLHHQNAFLSSSTQRPMMAEYDRHMTLPVALPAKTRKRGNPNWGRPIPSAPALPTEFELLVKHLQLTAEMYNSSTKLHTWCERNRNRCYVPEWLLDEWHITVDPNISAVVTDRHFSRHSFHFWVS